MRKIRYSVKPEWYSRIMRKSRFIIITYLWLSIKFSFIVVPSTICWWVFPFFCRGMFVSRTLSYFFYSSNSSKSGNKYSFMQDFWKIYLSKLQTKKQMSYNITLYVYLDVKNGLLLCLLVQKVGNGQFNN